LSTDDEQQTRVTNPIVEAAAGDTSESAAVGDTSESPAVERPTSPSTDRPTAASTRSWAPAGGESPAEAQKRGAEAASDPFNDRPHVWVAGAFVGGLVLAQILKRLGGGDDD
jgi:hypothetical protein